MSRLISGKFVAGYGEESKLGKRYGKSINTRWDVIENYITNKFTPSLSFFKKWADQRQGIEINWIDESIMQTLPIWMRDVKELYQEQPTEIAIMLNVLALFGGGVQTYSTNPNSKYILSKIANRDKNGNIIPLSDKEENIILKTMFNVDSKKGR